MGLLLNARINYTPDERHSPSGRTWIIQKNDQLLMLEEDEMNQLVSDFNVFVKRDEKIESLLSNEKEKKLIKALNGVSD